MSDEVAIIVKHKSTKAIIIFLLNRYSLVMFSAAALADFLPWDTQLRLFYLACSRITLTAFLLGILTVAVNLYLYIARHYEGVTRAAGMPFCIFKKYYSSTIYTECTQTEHYDVDAALTSSDVYSGIRSFDMLVLVVFWYKTYGIRQDAKKANGRPLLFYGLKGRFSALLVLNLSEIILIEEAFAYQTDFIAPCGFTQDIVDDHPTVHY
ncbi:predicted protein [Postia placenta Mad-698-R]|nr:predicted protein [Postia placenta Mad-698-R]